MKNLIIILSVIVTTITSFPQKMVVQKTDGTNMFLDMNTIETINFIIPCPGTETVDYGGKIYNTIQMGNQCWLKENLNVGVQASPSNNGTIEKYCYNNVEDSCTKYGGLYSWQEAMQYVTTEGARGICPTGWHMPKYSEYEELTDYINSNGNALKNEDQGIGAGQGTNTSGFSILLAGGKGYSGGPFMALGEWGTFWMGTQGYSGSYGCSIQLVRDSTSISLFTGSMISWGFSVRCIKD